MYRLPIPVRYQEIQTLVQAQAIIIWLDHCGSDLAIEVARAALVVEKRRQYLHEILPISVGYAIPTKTDTFIVECSDGQSFRLQDSTLPLSCQIMNLERGKSVQVVRVFHDDGRRKWTYCL